MTSKVVFMGTPEFSLPSLKTLLSKNYTLMAVYTQPPRPAGRGYALVKSPVHHYAEDMGLPVYTPTSLKSPQVEKEFMALAPDLAVVVAYGLLLPKRFLEIPSKGCINIHGSLLPR